MTAASFMSLFRNMSTNTPFFIFAALEHEGLVVKSKSKKRCYDRVDSTDFREAMQPLIEGRAPSQSDAKPKKNAGKKAAPVKTPSGPTKKAK